MLFFFPYCKQLNLQLPLLIKYENLLFYNNFINKYLMIILMIKFSPHDILTVCLCQDMTDLIKVKNSQGNDNQGVRKRETVCACVPVYE